MPYLTHSDLIKHFCHFIIYQFDSKQALVCIYANKSKWYRQFNYFPALEEGCIGSNYLIKLKRNLLFAFNQLVRRTNLLGHVLIL